MTVGRRVAQPSESMVPFGKGWWLFHAKNGRKATNVPQKCTKSGTGQGKPRLQFGGKETVEEVFHHAISTGMAA